MGNMVKNWFFFILGDGSKIPEHSLIYIILYTYKFAIPIRNSLSHINYNILYLFNIKLIYFF